MHRLAAPRDELRVEPRGRAHAEAVRDVSRARRASVARSGTTRSGSAEAGGVAPLPAFPARRSTQTRREPEPLSPAHGRGTGSARRGGHGRRGPRRARGGCSKPRGSGLYAPTCWAVTTGSNGDAETPLGGREQVVVAVRQHAEAIARPEVESGRRSSRGTAASRRPIRRTSRAARASRSIPRSASIARARLGEHVPIAAVRAGLDLGFVSREGREQVVVGVGDPVSVDHRAERSEDARSPSR